LVSSVLFVSLLIVCCGGGGNNNNRNEVQFKTIVAGGLHALALSNNGKVYAVGQNDNGQLGLGDNTDRNTFTEVTSLSGKNITALSAGYEHSLALSNDGKIYAAGRNDYGQLGLNDTTDRNTFTEVTDLSDKNITSISAGHYHSFALSDNGKVYATGWNIYGQLGLGDTANRNAFAAVIFLSDKNITALSDAGFGHSLALSGGGTVYAAGLNGGGQLGLGDTTDRNTSFTEVIGLGDKNITSVFAGSYHSLALSDDGKVYATGINGSGQLGLGNDYDRDNFPKVTGLGDKNITALSAGGSNIGSHSLALSDNGKVYATGYNNYGQLGLGNNTDRTTFAEVTSLSGKNITAISAGSFYSFALSNDGKIYAAGHNYNGQLGLGDNTNRNTFTKVTVWND
jgi:alpha-tubulin suppressor-like RCC1 family protein